MKFTTELIFLFLNYKFVVARLQIAKLYIQIIVPLLYFLRVVYFDLIF